MISLDNISIMFSIVIKRFEALILSLSDSLITIFVSHRTEHWRFVSNINGTVRLFWKLVLANHPALRHLLEQHDWNRSAAGCTVALAAGIYLVAIHRLAIWLIWCMNDGPLHSFPNSAF